MYGSSSHFHVLVTGLKNRLHSRPSALHHTVGATASHRTGGYTKNKWAVDFCPLEEVGSRFEGTRRSFETALILGQPECYQLA